MDEIEYIIIELEYIIIELDEQYAFDSRLDIWSRSLYANIYSI